MPRFWGLLWAVFAFDVLLAALFFPLAVSNIRAATPIYPHAFNLFFATLSCVTPFVVSGAAVALGKALVCKQPIG